MLDKRFDWIIIFTLLWKSFRFMIFSSALGVPFCMSSLRFFKTRFSKKTSSFDSGLLIKTG